MSRNAFAVSSIVTAVLAGGLGTRLRSVVSDRPKVLAEIGGKPFLSYLLAHLSKAGLRSVVLCTGYLGDQIFRTFGENWRELRLSYCREEQPLGTGGALRLALPHLTSNPILVLNGDSYCSADISAFISWFYNAQMSAAMLLTQVTNGQRYGAVKLADDGSVVEFREKNQASGPCWINAGIYLLSRDIVASIPENMPVSLEYDIFPHLVGRGLYGFQGLGRFLDIGTPEDFAAAENFFAAAE